MNLIVFVDAFQAIEKYCRTPSGYSGIKNVYFEDPPKDDVQQSYFLAETLKVISNCQIGTLNTH